MGGIGGALRGLFTFDIAGTTGRKWGKSRTERTESKIRKVEKVKKLPCC